MSLSLTDVPRLLAPEQIRGAAPDHATHRAADELARGDHWGQAGWCEPEGADFWMLWAEFAEGKRAPVRTTALLPTMRVACNCTAMRFPCRHVIALLLRDSAGQLPPAAPPDWADGLLRGRVAGNDKPVDPAGVGRREATLRNGMAALRLWLADLARHGLADLPRRDRRFWGDMADRLSGAYAVEAARELRELALIPGSGNEWPERLLPRLGRLALLAETFQRLDALPPGERGDALAAAGQPPRPLDDRVTDDWLLVGRQQETANRQCRERVWLKGVASGRWALLSDNHAAARREGVYLPPGSWAAGEVSFLPSAAPLAARLAADLRLCPTPAADDSAVAGDLDQGIAAYAAALAANPWLRVFPLALAHVFVEPPRAFGGEWRVRDRAGRLLPLPPRFTHGWRLLALTAGRPLALFGEWDGATFTPLSVYQDGWQGLAGWKGLP